MRVFVFLFLLVRRCLRRWVRVWVWVGVLVFVFVLVCLLIGIVHTHTSLIGIRMWPFTLLMATTRLDP